MLEELNIENLGVIESAQLSVANNLTVLTGETGAGKTMVLTSLGLLTGSKPDLGKVRAGSERAHVEGIFTLAENSKAANIITDAGGLIEDSTVVLAPSQRRDALGPSLEGEVFLPQFSLKLESNL